MQLLVLSRIAVCITLGTPSQTQVSCASVDHKMASLKNSAQRIVLLRGLIFKISDQIG